MLKRTFSWETGPADWFSYALLCHLITVHTLSGDPQMFSYAQRFVFQPSLTLLTKPSPSLLWLRLYKQLFQSGRATPRKSNWDLRNCGKSINWSIQSRPLGFKRKTTCFSLRSVLVPTPHISYLSTFFRLAGSFISLPLKPRSLLALGGFRRLQC